MERNKTYVGLSTSSGRSSIAIVSSAGDVQFAHTGKRMLERNGAFADSEDFERVIQRYCGPDTDIVLALSTNRRPSELLLGDPDFPTCNQGGVPGDIDRNDGRAIPITLRAARAATAFTRRSELHLLSRLAISFDFEYKRIHGWRQGVVETRLYGTHLAHAAAACFTAPYSEALCAIVDGSEEQPFGCYVYKDGSLFGLHPTCNSKHLGNLGALYSDVCTACGFQPTRGEHWKVMTLASFGKVDSRLQNVLSGYALVDGLALKAPSKNEMNGLYQRLDDVSRHHDEPILNAADLACTGQSVFEDVLCTLLQNLHATGMSSNLVLSGGCALNTSVNGSILERTKFKSLYIPSCPSADGNAIGAALLARDEDGRNSKRSRGFQTPYLGFEFQADGFGALTNGPGSCEAYPCGAAAPQHAAKLLAAGKAVGWVSGRAEFSPRALGNRSILADARQAGVRRLTEEGIRPFSLAVLHEYGSEYFEAYQTCPYGERALRLRPKVARKIPHILRKDGKVQVQSVKRDWNERLYDLIFCFYTLTGIPLVVNISCDLGGGCFVETLEDAFVTLWTRNIDAIFVNDVLITRKSTNATRSNTLVSMDGMRQVAPEAL